jgi:hypothetical protein
MSPTFNIGISWTSTFLEIEADNIDDAKSKVYDNMTQEEKEDYCDIYEVA